jgi:hypothetical protein
LLPCFRGDKKARGVTLIFGDNKSAQCGTASNQTPKVVIGKKSSYCDLKHFENDLYSFVKQLVQVFPNSIFSKVQ